VLSTIESTVVDFLKYTDLGTYSSGKPSQHVQRTIDPDTLYQDAWRAYENWFTPTSAFLSDNLIVANTGLIEDSTVQSRATTDSAQTAIPKPTLADATIAQLLRFELYNENWDGNGAARPLNESLKKAREFIRALSPESVIPRPALHADGHTVLLLNRHDAYAELEFLDDSRINYFAKHGGREWSGEISFNGSNLPQGLGEIGFAVT
jgi:hypothetical protein